MKLLPLLLVASTALAQTWTPQSSGTTASFRGLSVVSRTVAWASGTGGTYLLTTDGATWRAGKVPGAEQLDFRGVRAFDARSAYLLSIGNGDKSRIYKTSDGGANWTLLFTNPDAAGFFDAIAFWDARHGIVVGDQVEGHIVVFTTDDAGAHWTRQSTPPAIPREGSFAASNSCLTLLGKDAWFATGGPGSARVFHSRDRGRTWTVTTTPIRNDGPSAGIFSLSFSDSRHGVAVGGDYNKPTDTTHNVAVTSDGGRTWREPTRPPPRGFRSAVAYLRDRRIWVAAGTSGSDFSSDGGITWKAIDSGNYNAIGFVVGAGWAVGPRGNLAKWNIR